MKDMQKDFFAHLYSKYIVNL